MDERAEARCAFVQLEGGRVGGARRSLKVGVLASVIRANQSSSRPCAAKVAQIQRVCLVF